jgi:ribosomal protein S12 methylthiotransferase
MSVAGPSVWITTLGCAKNQVDSQKVMARLGASGYAEAGSSEDADVVLVNTCAFIEAAREESIDAVFEHAESRRRGSHLVVIGCMAQRYGSELEEAVPEAAAVIGLERYGDLGRELDRLTGFSSSAPPAMDILYDVRRPTPATPFAYVKAAEGCDKACSFCAIPQFRGRQRSRSPVNIREEVRRLCGEGVGEIVLVAQDLAAYGRDISAPGGIVELIRFLSDVDGLMRLRLLYLYPREISGALIEEMCSNSCVAPYFDLSLQHVSERLLSADSHLALMGRIRAGAAEAALRSSFIVGFPGETDDDVEALAAFLEEARLDWAGFFAFSPEDGTPAAQLEPRVDSREIAERMRYLQSIQDRITGEHSAAQVGRILTLLVDQLEGGVPVARSYREAPEIDGVINLDRGAPGEWLEARVVASYGLELSALVTA